ncbi:MAG: hypothetical protein ACI8RY_001003 [Urechidicola sp.]|jgi:hypothetical protein|tara:strand:- start:214 stop:441 length:228 start_codon:yes stop_codon:yes gene_type:complete
MGADDIGFYALYILKSRGIYFTIIEAFNRTRGKLAAKSDFTDFPIDLGVLWLKRVNSILGDLIKSNRTKKTDNLY